MCPPAGSLSSRVRAPPTNRSTSRTADGVRVRPGRRPFRSAALADSRDARAGPRTSAAERPPAARRPDPGASRPGPTPRPVSARPGRCDVSPPCCPGAFDRRRRVRARVPTARVPVVRPRRTARRLGVRGCDVPRPGRPFALGRPCTRARGSDVPRPGRRPDAPRGPARTQVRATAARPAAHRAYPGAVLVPATEGLTERHAGRCPRGRPPRPPVDPATTRVPQRPGAEPARASRGPPAHPAGRRRPHPACPGGRTRARAPHPAPAPRTASAPAPRRGPVLPRRHPPRTARPSASVYLGGLAAPKRTLRDILEATARAYPRAAAIDDGHQVLDYAALLREVDALGAMLSASGIGHGDRVGIRVPSGTADLYVADPRDAVDRRGLRARRRRRPRRARRHGVRRGGGLRRDRRGARRHAARPRPRSASGRGCPAWTTTRGSSSPRAPPGSRRASRSATAAPRRSSTPRRGCSCRASPLGPRDRVLAGLSVAFDASCEEMWLAWRHGACLVPAPRSLVRSGCRPRRLAGRAAASRSSRPCRRSPRCGPASSCTASGC